MKLCVVESASASVAATMMMMMRCSLQINDIIIVSYFPSVFLSVFLSECPLVYFSPSLLSPYKAPETTGLDSDPCGRGNPANVLPFCPCDDPPCIPPNVTIAPPPIPPPIICP